MIKTVRVLIDRFKHANLTFIDQILVSGVNFLTGILLARLLGIKEFGLYSLLWMGVLFVNGIHASVITAPMLSIGPKYQDKDRYHGAIFVQHLAFCVVVMIVGYLGVHIISSLLVRPDVVEYALSISLLLVCVQSQEFIRRIYFYKRNIVQVIINDIISYGGRLIVLCVLYFYYVVDLKSTLFAVSISAAIAAIAGVINVGKIRLTKDVIYEVTVRHWKFSRWLLASSIMQWTTGNIFVLIAGYYMSEVAVGAIAVVRNLFGPTLVIFSAYDNIVSVKSASKYNEEGRSGLIRYIVEASWIVAVIVIVMTIALGIFSEPLISLLFGDEYLEYGYLVDWFVVTHIVLFFIRPLNAFFKAIEQTRPIAISSMISVIVSVIGSVYLIEMYKLNGAMAVMLVTQIVALGVLFFYLKDFKAR